MFRQISSLQTLVSRFGIAATFQYVAIKTLNSIVGYRVYRCLALPAPFSELSGMPTGDGFVCREVLIDELLPYASDSAYDLNVSFLDEARARGYRCWGVFKNEVLASYSFVSSVPTPISTHHQIRFPERWVYLFKVMTLPRWRGLKLHAVQQREAMRALSSEVAGFMTLIQADNLSSLKAFERLGFQVRQSFNIYGKTPSLWRVVQKNSTKTSICVVEKLID